MAERDEASEGFLRRWSRLKREAEESAAPLPAAPETAAPDAPALPTLEDVAALGPDSDYSAFMAQGVDRSLRRLAMKKLFADPHFNTMDGLDIYIGDYTQASPVPAAMLAALEHARGMLLRGREAEEAEDDTHVEPAPLPPNHPHSDQGDA